MVFSKKMHENPINIYLFYKYLTRGDVSSLPVCSVSCTVHLQLFRQDQWDVSSLPVCSVGCTVHLQLFTDIDIL